MPEISVATWNLHHAVDHSRESMERTWGYLREEIRPSVALIQESDGVPLTPGGSVLSPRHPNASYRFETAVVGFDAAVSPIASVVSRYDKKRLLDLDRTVPISHAVARVEVEGMAPLAMASVYGLIQVYSLTTVMHVLADLLPLLDSTEYAGRVVIGGDFNAYDTGVSADARSRRRWAAFVGFIEALGLVNLLRVRREAERGQGLPPTEGCRCLLGDECFHVETWRARQGSRGIWCVDYLFVSPELAECSVDSVEVLGLTRPEVWTISDHCPLVARFAL